MNVTLNEVNFIKTLSCRAELAEMISIPGIWKGGKRYCVSNLESYPQAWFDTWMDALRLASQVLKEYDR